MTLSEEQIRSAVAQQAGEWFVANQAGGLSHQDRAAFVAWFKASPIHVEEYLGVALIASDLKVAADASHPPLEELIKQARFDPGDVVPFRTAHLAGKPCRIQAEGSATVATGGCRCAAFRGRRIRYLVAP